MELNKIDNKIRELNDNQVKIAQGHIEALQLAHYSGVDEVISSEEMKKLIEQDKQAPFQLQSNIPSLDAIIGSFRKGQLVVVSGQTGCGKTSFCQTLTMKFLSRSLWFSYEVGQEEFMEKFGDNIPLFFLPKTLKQNSMLWLETRIAEAQAKYNCEVVFIDHLHYLLEMQKMAEAKSLSLLVGMMMRELKKMAVDRGIVIFLVSHMKKLTQDHAPELDDLRDSSFVAQESDMVIFIKRIFDGEMATNKAKVGILKNRRTGKLGVFELQYNGNKFEELSKYAYENETH